MVIYWIHSCRGISDLHFGLSTVSLFDNRSTDGMALRMEARQMRTFKENVIELAVSESVVIRVERSTGQKPLEIVVSCDGWWDYEDAPNGLTITSRNRVRVNGDDLIRPQDAWSDSIEIIPDALVLDNIGQPTLTTSQQ
jgi:hypothetical protein